MSLEARPTWIALAEGGPVARIATGSSGLVLRTTGDLAMLAGHTGRAFTRRQLLDRVWGHDHGGDPRTVDVLVRWLRSRLEPQPGAPVHLVTVRGVGYRLDPGFSR